MFLHPLVKLLLTYSNIKQNIDLTEQIRNQQQKKYQVLFDAKKSLKLFA